MHEEPTSVIIQRYLDALTGDTAAEPVVRELLERAAGRLRLLCATFLYKSYPRLQTSELPRRGYTSRLCNPFGVVEMSALPRPPGCAARPVPRVRCCQWTVSFAVKSDT